KVQFRQHVFHDSDVILRLFQILFPLFLQVVVFRAAECGRVDLNASDLRFERLIQQFADLFVFHAPSLKSFVLQATGLRWKSASRRPETKQALYTGKLRWAYFYETGISDSEIK